VKKDDQSFPDTAHTALIVIDMINDLEFEGGETLLRYALPVAENIAGLKRRAKQAGIPVIYVNDNFGRWQSNLREAVDRCLQKGVCGRPLAERLRPDNDDYFVLKPKHSGFFGTPLEILLNYLGAKTLILTGISGDICVLFTAYDAYMRNFRLFVPADCIASLDPLENRHALQYMERVLKVDTKPSVELDGTAFQV
jgi:nicotinamidase-related amidase